MTQIQKTKYSVPNTPAGKIKEINERYALTISDVAAVLDVTSKTITRWKKNKKSINLISSQKRDRLEILKSILELGENVLGSDEELNKWLHSSVSLLDGNKPVDLIKTESGRRRIEEALHQIEFGIAG